MTQHPRPSLRGGVPSYRLKTCNIRTKDCQSLHGCILGMPFLRFSAPLRGLWGQGAGLAPDHAGTGQNVVQRLLALRPHDHEEAYAKQ